jgi:hypothetical protein
MSAWIIIEKSIKKAYQFRDRLCREEGIRTPDTLPYTRFPSVLLKPLGHLSIRTANVK